MQKMHITIIYLLLCIFGIEVDIHWSSRVGLENGYKRVD